MNQLSKRAGRLFLVGGTTALLGIVYGAQVNQSQLAWAVMTALIGVVCGRLMLTLDIKEGGERSLLINLLLGTVLGAMLGGLVGLPAVALGAMVGEAAALLVAVLPAEITGTGREGERS